MEHAQVRNLRVAGLGILVLVSLSLLVSCAAQRVRPDNGMALVVTTRIFGEKRYAVGKIVGITSTSDGRSMTYPNIPDRIQVMPGRYVAKYLCYLSSDGRPRDAINKHLGSALVDEVTLNAGDILYVGSEIALIPTYAPNGRYIGPVSTCTRRLKTVNSLTERKEDKNL